MPASPAVRAAGATLPIGLPLTIDGGKPPAAALSRRTGRGAPATRSAGGQRRHRRRAVLSTGQPGAAQRTVHRDGSRRRQAAPGGRAGRRMPARDRWRIDPRGAAYLGEGGLAPDARQRWQLTAYGASRSGSGSVAGHVRSDSWRTAHTGTPGSRREMRAVSDHHSDGNVHGRVRRSAGRYGTELLGYRGAIGFGVARMWQAASTGDRSGRFVRLGSVRLNRFLLTVHTVASLAHRPAKHRRRSVRPAAGERRVLRSARQPWGRMRRLGGTPLDRRRMLPGRFPWRRRPFSVSGPGAQLAPHGIARMRADRRADRATSCFVEVLFMRS